MRRTAALLFEKAKAGAKTFFLADHYDRNAYLRRKRFPMYPDYLCPSHGCAPNPTPPDDHEVATGWVPAACCSTETCSISWDARLWSTGLRLYANQLRGVQLRYRSSGTNIHATFVLEVRGHPGCGNSACGPYTLEGSVSNTGEFTFKQTLGGDHGK